MGSALLGIYRSLSSNETNEAIACSPGPEIKETRPSKTKTNKFN